MNMDMNMQNEIAKMKASLRPEITAEEHEANLAYLNSLDYNKKPDNVTEKEWQGILEYRRSGKIPQTDYEELDFNNVGGIIPTDNIKNE